MKTMLCSACGKGIMNHTNEEMKKCSIEIEIMMRLYENNN